MTAQAYQKLGRYLIVDEIATGGMATIYRAKLLGIEGFAKDVAIKKILPYWTHQQEFINMLIDEAKILVHLQHNNIVQVFELAKERDTYFIVMEYVNGHDLRHIINKLKATNTTVPIPIACRIVREICQGLEFAHTRADPDGHALNIVHRDISPQNIMIGVDGSVKITDFGIAKAIGKTAETAAGTLKGKFSYMSPEQALGRDIDHRTDLFALGALFHEILFLKKCFDGRNDLDVIEKIKNHKIDTTGLAHKTLQKILDKMLIKNVMGRYQTAAEIRRDLERFLREQQYYASTDDLRQFVLNLFKGEQGAAAHPIDITEEKTCHTASGQEKASTGFREPETTQNKTTIAPQPCTEQSITKQQNKTVIDQLTRETLPLQPTPTPEQAISETAPNSDPKNEATVLMIVPAIQPIAQTPVPKALTCFAPLDGHDLLLPLAKTFHQKRQNQKIMIGLMSTLFVITVFSFFSLLGPSLPTPAPVAVSVTKAFSQNPDQFINRPSKAIPLDRLAITSVSTPAISLNKEPFIALRAAPIVGLLISLSVETAPKDARITLTRENQSLNAKGQWSVILPFKGKPVTIPFEVRKTGYKTINGNLAVDEHNLIRHEKVTLEPEQTAFGTLSVSALPWGYVSVNNGPRVSTPYKKKLGVGKHTVTVSFPPQKKTARRTITLSVGQSLACDVSFEKPQYFLYCQ